MNEDFKYFNLLKYFLVCFIFFFLMKIIDDVVFVYNVFLEFGFNICMMVLYIIELFIFFYGFLVNIKRIYFFKDINGKFLSKIKWLFVIMKKKI